MKIAFPTDEHFPFQCEPARSVALQIVRDFDPDVRIAGSDGMDFYMVSHFDKNPERILDAGLQREIDLWSAGQREWRDASPRAVTYWLPGNHELRLRKYLWRNPELHSLRALEFPKLLDFAALGITSSVASEYTFHNLAIKHGEIARKFSGHSAKAELEREFHAVHVCTGHTHRGGSYYVTTRTGVLQAHECFCLCRLDPEYVSSPNWQQGITLIEASDHSLSVEAVPFFRYLGKTRAIWRGKEYIEV